MNDLERELLEACKGQHQAIDMLFARLIRVDPSFHPSESGLPWENMKKGKDAIKRAETTPPVGRGLPLKLLGIKTESWRTVLHGIAIEIQIGPEGIHPKQHDESTPVIAWTFTATNWLAWAILKRLYRKDKTQGPKALIKEKRSYTVYPLPNVADRMISIFQGE